MVYHCKLFHKQSEKKIALLMAVVETGVFLHGAITELSCQQFTLIIIILWLIFDIGVGHFTGKIKHCSTRPNMTVFQCFFFQEKKVGSLGKMSRGPVWWLELNFLSHIWWRSVYRRKKQLERISAFSVWACMTQTNPLTWEGHVVIEITVYLAGKWPSPLL